MKTTNFNVVNELHAVVKEQTGFYNRMMEQKIEKENTMAKKKLYLVDTVVTFRHRYVIEANELEHAFDEVTMRDSGNDADHFEEVTQLCLGEQISDGREISKKEFKKMLKNLEIDNRELSSYWMGDKLIRKIDYSR